MATNIFNASFYDFLAKNYSWFEAEVSKLPSLKVIGERQEFVQDFSDMLKSN